MNKSKYNDWAKECKKHLETKPHLIKIRWEEPTFKELYEKRMTAEKAAELLWLSSYYYVRIAAITAQGILEAI